jgi:hypothetical protein
MVLAFPFHMSHTLPIFHCVLLLVAPLGAFLMRTLLFHIYGTAKPFQVSRPKAVVYVRNYIGHLKYSRRVADKNRTSELCGVFLHPHQ